MPPGKLQQFQTGERQYYEGEARALTAEVAEEFDAVRQSLGLYPQAYELVTDFVTGLPHDSNGKLDAFIAFNLAQTMDGCARRLLAFGTRDPEDPDARLAHVDLSAARETPDPTVDDEAIRESFHDSATRDVDRDVAQSLGNADDAAIQESAGVHAADEVLRDRELEELQAIAGELSGQEAKPHDEEDDEEDGNEGGSEGVQLGMLDSAGSEADPVLCAQKTAAMLFAGVLYGFTHAGTERPSLRKRMRPLVDHGVLKKGDIKQMIQGIMNTLAKFHGR